MRRAYFGSMAVVLLIVIGLSLPMKSDAKEDSDFPSNKELKQNNVALLMEGFRFASGLNRNSKGRPNGKGFEVVPASWVGSGFIATADGKIITNYHVASKALRAKALFDDKSTYEIRHISCYNDVNDLAVLKITADRQFPAVELGNSDEVEPRDKVLAVGNPRGMGINMTEGGVSQVVRDDYNNVQIIRHTAPIASGNSGGSLYKGHSVIGVNASIILAAYGPTQFNQAIPINKAKRLLAKFKDHIVPLTAAFPTELAAVFKHRFKAIDGGTAKVDGLQPDRKPGIRKFQFQFDHLKDYVIVLNCPNQDMGIAVANSQGELIGFADEGTSGSERVAISSKHRENVTICALNYDAKPAQFYIKIGYIEW